MVATQHSVTKSEQRARRDTHAAQYAPRAPARLLPPVVEGIRVRRLTAQTLDALKLPGAVPSRVLMAAFSQALAMGIRQ
jgi:hypothetical protein